MHQRNTGFRDHSKDADLTAFVDELDPLLRYVPKDRLIQVEDLRFMSHIGANDRLGAIRSLARLAWTRPRDPMNLYRTVAAILPKEAAKSLARIARRGGSTDPRSLLAGFRP